MCRVVTYWCMIGTIGVSAPTIAERRGAHWPAALRTIAVCTVPLSVSTCVTAPAPSRPMPGDAAVRLDGDAEFTGALGELERDAVGVHPAVVGDVHRALDAVGVDERRDVECLLGGDGADVEAEPARAADVPLQRLERFGLEARRRLPTLCQPMLLAPSALNWS